MLGKLWKSTAAACAGALMAATLAGPALAADPVEVTFYYPVAVGGPITKIIDQYAADFQKENPDIKVTPIYSGTYQETIVKALTANKSGTPPTTAVLLSTDMFSLIDEDAIVAIKGRTDAREDTVKLIGYEVTILDTSESPRGPVNVRIETTRCTPPLVDRLKDVLRAHPGTTEVHLQLQGKNNLRMVVEHRVTPSPALMGDLKALLGPTAVSA